MLRRAALLLAVFTADWLAFMPVRLGYAPQHTTIGRVMMIAGLPAVVAIVAIVVAVRYSIFSRAELGLETTEFQRRHRLTGWRGGLVMLGLFVVGTLSHMLPPVNYSLVNDLSYTGFIDLVRSNEWRWTFARSPPPVDAGDIALVFAKGVVLAPLIEEVPYRALFVPTLLARLGRVGTAVASGVVFLGVHTLVYGVPVHASYFLVGAVLAFVFFWFGLLGAFLFHAGCNFGLIVLALIAEFCD